MRRDRLREHGHAGLRHGVRVDRKGLGGLQAEDRTDVDDRAATLALHVRDHRPGEAEHSLEEHVHHAVPDRIGRSPSSVTLPGTASAWPPTAAIASAISPRISLRRPVIVTLAPSRANVVAMAAPMPVPPPVTMATLSASRMEVSRSGLTGRVLVCVSRGFDGGVRTATEHDARDAVARRPPRNGRVPGEQAERAAIFCQHVSAELMDASLLSRTKDLLEKDRTESESLPAVLHDETDFGGGHFVAGAVPRHADQFGLLPVGDFGDERHPLAIVDVGQGVRFLWKEPPEGEESLVHRAWAQPMAQGHQARPVVGADRAEANGGAVAQCHWFTLARSRRPAARPWAPHRRPGRRARPP